MLEFLLLAVAGACVMVLLRPVLRRWPLPGWLVRARIRRRPGIPITSLLAAFLLMEFAWLFGEQRGGLAVLALAVWIGAPLTAAWVTWYWLKGLRKGSIPPPPPELEKPSVD